MAPANVKLARSLSALMAIGDDGRRKAFESAALGRTDRERLLAAGYLREILPGWLMMARPGEAQGDTTSWHASFWEFVRAYLDRRFGDAWVLSAESSLGLLADDLNVPRQVVVRSPGANNAALALPHGTSLFAYRVPALRPGAIERRGVRVPAPAAALAELTPHAWTAAPESIAALIGSLRESDLVGTLVEGGHVAAAGRVAGACRRLGRDALAEAVLRRMRTAGYDVREEADPFRANVSVTLPPRPVAPVATRIRLAWASMRGDVLGAFPEEPRPVADRDAYLAALDQNYAADAYHSLSIEGYRVSEDLVERVRRGDYDPSGDPGDRSERDALAAKGYWLAFQRVREAVALVLDGADAADLARDRHLDWFQALFAPAAEAGLLKAGARLASYRSHLVFLQGSGHVPVAWEAVPDAMDAFFDCLAAEADPRVRAVLGHYLFTFVHPLPDGNGRCGRFVMNLMLASGGYPWTTIPVDRRAEYMAALEAASGKGDIVPFAALVADCVALKPPPPRRLRRGERPEVRGDVDTGPGSTDPG